ncbi:cleavage/polyadenylation specificity factor, 25kDa subunit, partial [Tanacetum coccineum]
NSSANFAPATLVRTVLEFIAIRHKWVLSFNELEATGSSIKDSAGGYDGSKFLELVDILRERRVDIACFQETKWKWSSARLGNGYKLWYSGSKSAKNRVGIIMAERFKDNIVEVKRCNDRIVRCNYSSTPIPSEFFKDQRCPHFSSCSDSATKDQDLKETLSVQLGSLVGNAKLNAKLNDVDLL